MSRTEYWRESLAQALDDIGINYNSEQLDELTDYITGIQEVESQALGYDCIPNPLQTEIDKLKQRHKEDIKDLEDRKNAIEDLALKARGLSSERAYVQVDYSGTAHFERRL